MHRLDTVVAQLQNTPVSAAFQREEQKYSPGHPWTNWVGLHGVCRPRFHHRPSTVEEVIAIVKQAANEKLPVHAVGLGKSPSTIGFTEGHMVHLAPHMGRILNVDSQKNLVSCEGGCTLEKLNAVLAGHDLMLPILPSISTLTIAGFLAVAAHSTGINKPALSANVVAAKMVVGNGEVITADKRTGENVDLLPAFACSLGVLGIMVEVTLQVEPRAIFKISSNPSDLQKIHKTVASKVTMIEAYRFWWIPHTDKCFEVSVRRIHHAEEGGDGTTRDNQSAAGSTAAGTTQGVAPNATERVLKTSDAKKVISVAKLLRPTVSEERTYVEWLEAEQQWPRQLIKKITHCPRVGLTVTQGALAAASYVPKLQPFVNDAYRRVYLNSSTERYGNQNDAFDIPIVLPQNACEWAFPAAMCLEVLDGLRELIRRNQLETIHFIVEVRFCDEDQVWMSPTYRRKSCYIGLVQFMPFGRPVTDTERYYRLFSEYIIKKGGRPHWSKYLGQWRYQEMDRAYPKWKDFLALRKRLDPQGTFTNDWFKQFLHSH